MSWCREGELNSGRAFKPLKLLKTIAAQYAENGENANLSHVLHTRKDGALLRLPAGGSRQSMSDMEIYRQLSTLLHLVGPQD